MNDSKPAYGNLLTGKVIPAHAVAGETGGDSAGELLMPDKQIPLDHNEWVPGAVTADGRFHPRDESRLPPAGKWVVEFRDFRQALTELSSE